MIDYLGIHLIYATQLSNKSGTTSPRRFLPRLRDGILLVEPAPDCPHWILFLRMRERLWWRAGSPRLWWSQLSKRTEAVTNHSNVR